MTLIELQWVVIEIKKEAIQLLQKHLKSVNYLFLLGFCLVSKMRLI